MPQGEGWWIASDGRWYPPYLHPDALRAPSDEPGDVGGTPPYTPPLEVRDEVSGVGWEETAAEQSFEEHGADAAGVLTAEAPVEAVESSEAEEPEATVAEAELPGAEGEAEGEAAEEEESLDGHALEELAAEAVAEVETHPEQLTSIELEGENGPPHFSLEEGNSVEDAEVLAAAAAAVKPLPERPRRPRKKIVIGDMDDFFASFDRGAGEADSGSRIELPGEERARRHRQMSAIAAIILVLLAAGVVTSFLVGQHDGKPSTTSTSATASTLPSQSTTSSTISQRELAAKASLKLDDMPSGWVTQPATAIGSPFSTPASRDHFLASHPHCRAIAYAFSASASPTSAVTGSYRTPMEGTPAFGEVQTNVTVFRNASSVAADVSRVASLETPAGLACLSSAISGALVASLNHGYVATASATKVPLRAVRAGGTGFAFEVSGTLLRDSVSYPFQVFVARIVSSRFEGSLLTGSIANGGPSIPLAEELLATLGTRIEGLGGSA